MRKNNSLPELQPFTLSPNKVLSSGWQTKTNSKWSVNFKEIDKRNFDIVDLRSTVSVFPAAKRQLSNPRKRTRNSRRSHHFNSSQRKLIMRQFEIESEMSQIQPDTNFTKMKNNDEDSDINAVSDSNREGDVKTKRYVGKEAYNHYYNNYK